MPGLGQKVQSSWHCSKSFRYTQAVCFDVTNAAAMEAKRTLLGDFLARETRAMTWAQNHHDAFAQMFSLEAELPLPIAKGTVECCRRSARRVFLDTFGAADENKGPRALAGACACLV